MLVLGELYQSVSCYEQRNPHTTRLENFNKLALLSGEKVLNIEDWKHYFVIKVKVKFSLEWAMKAQRGSRDIALLFL